LRQNRRKDSVSITAAQILDRPVYNNIDPENFHSKRFAHRRGS